jgi:hypothetical protein
VKEMMKALGKYMRKKKLKENVQKAKMIVFNERKSEENEWKWESNTWVTQSTKEPQR